jgi:hypothetical protein
MKRVSVILILLAIILAGCRKVEPIPRSGIVTIDNIRQLSTTAFVYGFSFSQAKLISNLGNPHADITLYVNTDNQIGRLTLSADNFNPSFYKAGDFADVAAAETAFSDLKSITVTQWQDFADPIDVNQIWIYRTGSDTYAKIRIISTINETRQGVVYGECTFQWVYQPDGTLTFPGK